MLKIPSAAKRTNLRDEGRIEDTTITEYERVLTKVVIPEIGGLRLRGPRPSWAPHRSRSRSWRVSRLDQFMRRRKRCAAVLIAVAALMCGFSALWDASQRSDGRRLSFYIGMTEDAIFYWPLVTSCLVGIAGLVLLLWALISRIGQKWLRLGIGWVAVLAGAAVSPYLTLFMSLATMNALGFSDHVRVTADDGRSVLIIQDGFDGGGVEIYTQQDNFHYAWNRSAPEISGWPRIKDRNCQLSGEPALVVTCGEKRMTAD